MSAHPPKPETILQGVPASPGVAQGSAFVFLQKELEIPVYQIDDSQRPAEVKRFEQAIAQTRTHLTKLRAEVAQRLGEQEAQVLDAHLLVLEDNALIDETIKLLHESGYNIDYCYHVVAQRFIEAFGNLNDEYIKERVTDLRDVTRRVIHNLLGHSAATLARLGGQRIVVSEDLTPSETAGLDKSSVLAIATDGGSRTSHVVIIARSLQIPAVVGLRNATARIDNGDTVLVDGYDGLVIINPSEQTLFRYGQLRQRRLDQRKLIDAVTALPCETRDGHRLQLCANINGPEDVPAVRQFGAEGVGLYRTESLFISRDQFPPEEEQYQVYKKAVEELRPLPIIIRTFDLGGDKRLSHLNLIGQEDNPFMGFRAIRFCLEFKDIFREQLRAILRASVHGRVKIMYPMISGLAELVQANLVLDQAKAELTARHIPFDPNIPVGAMIEIPSAAWTADQLAPHCAFFSIGTNDLIQYLLAVDRVNERVAHLYEPAHPAVLRAIKLIIETARAHRIPVSICGEMGGDPIFTPLFLAFGATELSVTPAGLPEVKYLLRNLTFPEAQALADAALRQTDPKVTLDLLRRFHNEHLGPLAQPAP